MKQEFQIYRFKGAETYEYANRCDPGKTDAHSSENNIHPSMEKTVSE